MRRHLRTVLVVAVVFALILGAQATIFGAELVILHTNDVHGRLVSFEDGEAELGGLARLATVVDEIREQYGKSVLLLDAGDAIHGTNVVNLFEGRSSIEVMNAIGYNAMTLGNHDFNYGQEALLERMAEAKFPMLAANVTTEAGETFAYSALVQQFGELRVGIIGVSSLETPVTTHPNNVVGLVFHDPIEVAKNLAVRIRPEVDVLIALTHIGYLEDLKLAEAVPEFDVIVGGHSHTELEEAVEVGGVLLVQSHEWARNLGFLRIEVEDGQIKDYEQHLIPITDAIEPNAKVMAIYNGWEVLLEEKLNQVVGSTAVFFDGERANVRTQETNLGNLIADIMREATGADVAITNGGGIRASLAQGEVTVGDIYTVLPFDNTLTVIQVSGRDLLAALEHSARLYPEQNGGFLQVSGMLFAVNPRMSGKRIFNVRINDEHIMMDKLYTVATNDFLAAGGDGYEVLQNGTIVAETGLMLRDVVVDYFLKHGTVEEPEGGRIIFLK